MSATWDNRTKTYLQFDITENGHLLLGAEDSGKAEPATLYALLLRLVTVLRFKLGLGLEFRFGGRRQKERALPGASL